MTHGRLRGVDRSEEWFHSRWSDTVGFACLVRRDHEKLVAYPSEWEALGSACSSRRWEFSMGRRAARLAMGKIDQPEVPIPTGSHREPVWPRGVLGSISHTTEVAVAIVSHEKHFCALGIDIEDVREFDMSIQKLIMSDIERWWAGRDTRRCVAVFSAKEAVFKAMFPHRGAYFGFDAVRLKWENEHFVATLLEPMGPLFGAGARFIVDVAWGGTHVLTSVAIPVLSGVPASAIKQGELRSCNGS